LAKLLMMGKSNPEAHMNRMPRRIRGAGAGSGLGTWVKRRAARLLHGCTRCGAVLLLATGAQLSI